MGARAAALRRYGRRRKRGTRVVRRRTALSNSAHAGHATRLVGPLALHHRERVAEILEATGVFSPAEVDVALELFDDGMRSSESYELMGTFDERGGLQGYACWGPTPGTDGGYDLYWIAVDPRAQGGGYGSALLRAVEEMLCDRGARLLVAETSSRDAYAQTRDFYERGGYVERARVRGFYAVDDDRVIFSKMLAHRASQEARHE